MKSETKRFKLPFHVVKRLDMPKSQYWTIKVCGFFTAFLLAAILCTILSPGTFGIFFERMAYGIYNPKDPKEIFDFFETAGLLILVAFALAPAFKMKFWNIGAEGQIAISCLVTALITYGFEKNTHVSDPIIIFTCLAAAILAGIIWAVIPAIFKAFFNTNEVLFTLMMNYVATSLISVFIAIICTNGSQTFPYLNTGSLPRIFNIKYLCSIFIIIVVVALMIIYLKKTKHGYELSVVGASVNTARYVGINVKKVIIRTMILSGAISGLVGFLLVAGHQHTLTASLVDGRGFTGVLIAWLGQFEPGQMILYGFLVAFFQRGSTKAASYAGISKTDFSAIVTGMFFLIVIATEFFVNYRFLVEKDSKLRIFLDYVERTYNELFYGSNDIKQTKENIQKGRAFVMSQSKNMDESQFKEYLDSFNPLPSPLSEVNKEVVLNNKKELLAAKKEFKQAKFNNKQEKAEAYEKVRALNNKYSDSKLALKWNKYATKKVAKVKKSFAVIYAKNTKNGGSK